MQKLGQHFLKNKFALRLIAESLDLAPDDVVIEIGPGHGELTEFLRSAHCKSQIILVEKDKKLSDLLKEKFAGDSRITVMEGDARRMLAETGRKSLIANHNYKIVGNIPYYITGHLLRILGELGHKPSRCVFTIQKEVAERVCAAPPRMNRLAASVQFWANVKIIKTLPASDFIPPPKVSSAIVALETIRPTKSNTQEYYAAVRALFTQPRKTVVNNLAVAIGKKKDVVAEKLSIVGIHPGGRAQNLGVDDVITVAKTFF